MYPPEIRDEIAEQLTRSSLRSICSADGMPDRGTVERWMQEDASFAARCAHARSIQADHVFDGMESLEDGVLSGEVDAVAARVVLSSRQWRLAKMLPKKYGDKVEQIHSGSIGVEKIRRTVVDPESIGG